jgi:hypothetical protein
MCMASYEGISVDTVANMEVIVVNEYICSYDIIVLEI